MKNSILIFLLLLGLNCFAQDSVQLNTILTQLDLDESKCKNDLITSKILPNTPELTIYVIPEIVEEDEFFFALNSHILITDSKTGKIKYKYFESSETNKWYSDAVRLESISIDTAPYNVAKNNRAFGIRVSYYGSSRPNPYSSETISLFVMESDSLKQVLNNYVVKQFNGEWDMNCEGEFTEQKKVLIIKEELTNGYYDILVRNTTSTTKSFLDENDNCDETEFISNEKHLLLYENGKYK